MVKYIIMNKYAFLLILSSFITTLIPLKAQSPDEHEASFFQTKEGDLFWNMDLPVYITLSSSPAGERQSLFYGNDNNVPFRFVVEGLNYIKTPWAVDKETQKQVSPRQTVDFPVWADGSAPVVSCKIVSRTHYNSNSGQFYSENTGLVLSAKDKYSGTKAIYYREKGQAFTSYSDTINFKAEGIREIEYYAADRVGNVSKVKQIQFTVDKSPPHTKLTAENSAMLEKNILEADSRLVLSAEDNYSGVKSVFYQINEEEKKLYTSPVTMKYRETGDYVIKYYAVDNLGNAEDEQTYSFYLDKSPPMVASRIIGDVYKIDNKTFFSGRTQLQLTGFDNKAGVKLIRYSVDGQEYTDYGDNPIYLPVSQGYHSIKYYAVDSTGNDSRNETRPGQYTYKLEKYYLDLTGPEINFDINGPQFIVDSVLYLSPKSKVVIKTNDRESGTDYSAYSFNGEQRETAYKQPVDLSGLSHGENSMDLYAYDNVNNRNISSFAFYMDAKGPELDIHFGSQPIRKQDGKDAYPDYVSVYITAKDETTEIASVSYRLNNGQELPYSGIIRGFSKGKMNTLEVTATDLLGNISLKSFQFYIQ